MRRLALAVFAAVSAFAAHALAYGTLRPADPAHAYFAWYGPAVAVCSLAAVAAVAVLVVLAALGRRPRSLPAPSGRALVAATFVVLLAQESVEKHRLVAQTPSQLLLLLAASAVTALLLARALRAIRTACVAPDARIAHGVHLRWTPVVAAARVSRVFAGAVALRGPPLFAG